MSTSMPLFQGVFALLPSLKSRSPHEGGQEGPQPTQSPCADGGLATDPSCQGHREDGEKAPEIELDERGSGPKPKRRFLTRTYCNRFFSESELEAIRALIAQNPSFCRAKIAREVCQMLPWLRENGELKKMTCVVALGRMHDDGLITLPRAGNRKARSKPSFPATVATDPQSVESRPVHELPALTLRSPQGVAQSRLWNEYIERYHYLGFNLMAGAQMRFNVYCGDRLVALISFGASAWKLAGRESFIGWSEEQRQRNLQLVVNNARFLILPWIQSKGLASKILALCARELPALWQARYGYRPVLLETFVETPRHKGTCYKAANWVQVGQTVGRGKKCPVSTAILPIKNIWLYPLSKNFRAVLCASE